MSSLTRREIRRRWFAGEPARRAYRFKLSEINKEWINKYIKTTNINGCWIPKLKPTPDGYVSISIEGNIYRLHRLVICIYYNLEYHDKSWESRHNKNCSRSCFNPEHLKPGTISDNVKDSVEHGTHPESRRLTCKDGHPLDGIQRNRNKWSRYCKTCKRLRWRA